MEKLITIADFKHVIRCSKAAYLNRYHQGLATDNLKSFNDSKEEIQEILCKQIQVNGIQISKLTTIEERNIKTHEIISTKKRYTIHNATLISKDKELVEVACIQKGDKTFVWILKNSPGEPKGADIWAAGYQYYVLQKCGLKVDKFFITFLNPEFVHGQNNPSELFLRKNVADKCRHLQLKIEKHILRLKKTLNYSICPEVLLGYQCPEPKCTFYKHCWSELQKGNVFEFANMSFAQKFRLYSLGHERMIDVPANTRLTAIEKIQLDSHKKDRPYISTSHIKNYTAKLNSSNRTLFLDLNVAKTALSIYPGSKPFSTSPYHFNILKEVDGISSAENFTANPMGKYDTREEFVKKLITALEPNSNCPIVVWNETYFKSYFNEYKKWYPNLSIGINNIQKRLIGLCEPFIAFHYYHPEFAGRTDFWAVLRVFVSGKPYPFLNIRTNWEAQKLYAKMKSSSTAELIKLRSDLKSFASFKSHALRTILSHLKSIN